MDSAARIAWGRVPKGALSLSRMQASKRAKPPASKQERECCVAQTPRRYAPHYGWACLTPLVPLWCGGGFRVWLFRVYRCIDMKGFRVEGQQLGAAQTATMAHPGECRHSVTTLTRIPGSGAIPGGGCTDTLRDLRKTTRRCTRPLVCGASGLGTCVLARQTWGVGLKASREHLRAGEYKAPAPSTRAAWASSHQVGYSCLTLALKTTPSTGARLSSGRP